MFQTIKIVRGENMIIYTPELEKIGEINDYESLTFKRVWEDVGTFEFEIPNDAQYAIALFDDNFILIDEKRAGIITSYHIDKNDIRTVKGYQIKAILRNRIIIPPSHTTHDRRYAEAETVMKHYVDRHAVYPSDSARLIPNLVLKANQKRGNYLQVESRLKNLAEQLKEISLASGLGWDVYLDEEARQFVFDVQAGKNLTRNQQTYPPVIFSTSLENVLEREFEKDTSSYKNTAYVGGQGEGEDRRIVETYTEAATGLARKEVFIDARDISNQTEDKQEKPESEIIKMLKDRGKQKLENEFSKIVSFVSYVTEKPGMEYEKDWTLGDIVTCEDDKIGVQMDARVTDVEEVYQNNKRELKVTFGTTRLDVRKLLQREFAQINNIIRN
ncbi:siphovirus ReqiPepy6 Gp37-like family protein [Bacillus paranthracis]|uniref:siphovirus ReqiPepy6 Gp37-like family protein n=7 Tax=Bacillus TaxID=1386 RepID=UPI0028525D28|nr:siphovirus ReqiPepy6 Gp37-like family protein [Bacillus paranthracis]